MFPAMLQGTHCVATPHLATLSRPTTPTPREVEGLEDGLDDGLAEGVYVGSRIGREVSSMRWVTVSRSRVPEP